MKTLNAGVHPKIAKQSSAQTKSKRIMSNKVDTDDIGPDGVRPKMQSDYKRIIGPSTMKGTVNKRPKSTPSTGALTLSRQQKQKQTGMY